MADNSATVPARLATRLAFFAAGFAIASCAPLFPFFKINAGVDEAQFGLLLLCLGGGSVLSMPAAGVVAARYGPRPMILLGGLGLVVLLPLLTLAASPLALGLALFAFGAALGAIDVAMNVHGAEVEGMENRPLMSSFHAQFSVGSLFGAGIMTVFLSLQIPMVIGAVLCAVLTLATIVWARSGLLTNRSHTPAPLQLPKGLVLLLAILAALVFLVEGAVLDWGALLIIDLDLAMPERAGIGYFLFSIAMVIARLTGDRVIAAIGELRVLVFGGIATVFGVATILTFSSAPIALSGFVLIGFGAANLAPILFSAAGRQTVMPPGLAVASVTTTGYAGILLGPAMIGFAAQVTSLPTAFWLLALLVTVIPLSARFVVRA